MTSQNPYGGFDAPRDAFWLFAYGSLMWEPNFPFVEQRRTILHGYHRALCVYSWVYRGTEETPGLVFGLEEGGTVEGIAFHIASEQSANVFAQVYEREMVTAVYSPVWASCNCTDGTKDNITALAFVANHSNEQYAGERSESETVELIRQGHGKAGPCTEYVMNTVNHLRELDIHDDALERITLKLRG
jgi:cation transport protein ChaC